jgi:uncharacterized protein YkwD
VEAGDTLLNLALQYDVPMAAIQLHNDLGSSTNLQVGELLEIPPPVEWEGAGPFWVVYEVRAGETLGGIAAAHDVDLDRLREVNGLSYADLLTVGQSLVLPVEELTEVSQPPRPTPTLVPLTPSSTPTPPTSPLPTPTEEVEPPPAPPPVSEAPADADAMAAELFRLINEERARHDLPPYVWNETLAQAARLHAADCSERGSCSHTGSDGSTVTERVKRLGYPAGWAAETIMTTDTPAGALEWWMDETPPNDPHRQMILHDWFTEIGIGIAPSRWGYYFVADYGRPK